jgi:hypothetical protein
MISIQEVAAEIRAHAGYEWIHEFSEKYGLSS